MIYLIGTGPMAQDYANVLVAQKKEFIVIGRSIASAENFEKICNKKPFVGGFDEYLKDEKIIPNSKFIIATGTEMLMHILKKVTDFSFSQILIEKPAAISIEELLENESFLKPYLNNIFVAYNRRFYTSVQEAKKIIIEDGGLQSMNFEFTEWSHKIEPLIKAEGVKQNWFFANSTHVVDLAFYFAGHPIKWNSYSKNIPTINWHEKAVFVGSGVTDKNVLFSYSSNWDSAGRWKIELMTSKRKIYLEPLENLFVQAKGTIQKIEHVIENKIDIEYKAGLFNQTTAFIENDFEILCSLNEHIKNTINIYKKITE